MRSQECLVQAHVPATCLYPLPPHQVPRPNAIGCCPPHPAPACSEWQVPRPHSSPLSISLQAETSAEGLLSARARKEDRRPAAGKRKAKAREKMASYCAGCYSNLMLRSPPAAPDGKEGKGSSKH